MHLYTMVHTLNTTNECKLVCSLGSLSTMDSTTNHFPPHLENTNVLQVLLISETNHFGRPVIEDTSAL